MKKIALLTTGGKGIFYNMETNRFSQKFSRDRLLQTGTPSRWFYWEFDKTTPAIRMKEITDEMDSLLEWRVLLAPGEDEDEAAVAEFVDNLQNPEFFSIVKPAEKPQDCDLAP